MIELLSDRAIGAMKLRDVFNSSKFGTCRISDILIDDRVWNEVRAFILCEVDQEGVDVNAYHLMLDQLDKARECPRRFYPTLRSLYESYRNQPR